MIKFRSIPQDIESRLTLAAQYLASHPQVIFAYLFGSLARGRLSPLSDVDLAIYLGEGANFAETKLEILCGLMDALETDEIDLVILNTAPPALVMNILSNKRLLVDKMPFERHKFESLAMRKYFDFSIKERAVLKRRYLGG